MATITGSSGNDTISGTTASDSISGLAGDDSETADDGNGSVDGGAGNDSITGEAGNDELAGGAGSDTPSGGRGNDTLAFDDGSGPGTIADFDIEDGNGEGFSNDQLDVTNLTNANGNPVRVWDVAASDAGGGNTLRTFPNGETVLLEGVLFNRMSGPAQLRAAGIPCFTPGTMIDTPRGAVAVEMLRPGDVVGTLDRGGTTVAVVRPDPPWRRRSGPRAAPATDPPQAGCVRAPRPGRVAAALRGGARSRHGWRRIRPRPASGRGNDFGPCCPGSHQRDR